MHSPIDIMREAIAAQNGLRLITSDEHAALKVRSQLYGARRRARAQSDTSFDNLSFVVEQNAVLVIIRQLKPAPAIKGIEAIIPLDHAANFRRIGVRGPAKLGLLNAVAILDELARAHS